MWASNMCIRGARSSTNKPILDSPIDLQVADYFFFSLELKLDFVFFLPLACLLVY